MAESPGVTNVTLTVIDRYGITDTDTFELTVNPMPTIAAPAEQQSTEMKSTGLVNISDKLLYAVAEGTGNLTVTASSSNTSFLADEAIFIAPDIMDLELTPHAAGILEVTRKFFLTSTTSLVN